VKQSKPGGLGISWIYNNTAEVQQVMQCSKWNRIINREEGR